jgi:hypothetical protein
MVRRNKHKHTDERTRLRRAVAASATLGPRERLMAFYCWDLAWCDCSPTTSYHQVPCISVGVVGPRQGARVARCLNCRVRWLVPGHRRIDRIAEGAVR